ncbi:MAG: LytR C-terminal domain-containing protein [Acidimicrobiales bacterium]
MTFDQPPSGPEPSGERQGPSRISPVRAGLVLIGFVIAAAVLVAVGTRPSVSGVTASTVTTTTTHSSGVTTTTKPVTTTTLARSATSVQVANGSQGVGLAAQYSDMLSSEGWATKPPEDATAQVPTSAVYYAAGQQEAAAAIATAMKLKPSAVHPLTTSVPVAGATGNDVVVVIGADLVPPASS